MFTFSTNETNTYSMQGIWSAAEASMGVIAACIPSLRPLLSLLVRGTVLPLGVSKERYEDSEAFASLSSHSSWSRPQSAKKMRCKGYRLGEAVSHGDGCDGLANITYASGPAAQDLGEDSSPINEGMIPSGKILVECEVTVVTSNWIEYHEKVY